MSGNLPAYVETVKDRCKVCYTCVRECPAKAIKISDGQAEIIPECCIGCGNCVLVCSQDAKRVISTIPDVNVLLKSGYKVAACLAPSFPAEFKEFNYKVLVGMLHRLGFDLVTEVAFGADLVAAEYKRLLLTSKHDKFIATTCPAVVSHVEKFYPEMVKDLAPIVSPMTAMSRVLKEKYGPALKKVFIGPCIAKKAEAAEESIVDNMDVALTFSELRQMFIDAGIEPNPHITGEFDPPHPGLGALFPIGGGMLQAADIKEDLMMGDVVTAEGREHFRQAMVDFESGVINARLLEVLCCNGCIMGAGMTSKEPMFHRRSRVSKYVREQFSKNPEISTRDILEKFKNVNLERSYTARDQRSPEPTAEQIRIILKSIGKETLTDELNCGACGYHSCRNHARAIYKGRAEKEMCLPYMIGKMKDTVGELRDSNDKLASTREALLQSEKLASMGQLAAGVAHEVNNPLGVVLMYAHLLLEETSQNSEFHEDLKLIASQADRCKAIVQNLLDFARENKVLLQPCDAEDLLYRSIQSVPAQENITVKIHSEVDDPNCELDADQIIQVLTNLISNAFAAMPDGGKLEAKVSRDEEEVIYSIKDNGTGIPEDIKDKIFDPFFTTKKIGKGTGLGLAVAYGIIKMHKGNIKVISNSNPETGPTGTEFILSLPALRQET